MPSWIMMADGECMMRWPGTRDDEAFPRVIWLRSDDPFGRRRHRETKLERPDPKKRARRSTSIDRAKEARPKGRNRTA